MLSYNNICCRPDFPACCDRGYAAGFMNFPSRNCEKALFQGVIALEYPVMLPIF
jgi:hypothetical protein